MMLESHRLTTRRCRSTLAEESQAKRIHTAKLLAALDKFPCSSLLLSRTSLLLFACQCDSCVKGSSSLSGDFPTHCPVSPPRSQTYSVCSVKWTCSLPQESALPYTSRQLQPQSLPDSDQSVSSLSSCLPPGGDTELKAEHRVPPSTSH